MQKRKTFKSGTPLSSLAEFVKAAADELTGDTASALLPATLRVVVETVRETEFDPAALLDELNLSDAATPVREFLEYRRNEIRSPVKTVAALRRLLLPFQGQTPLLREAVEQSMQQSWKGLFVRGIGSQIDRTFDRSGGSDGGTW